MNKIFAASVASAALMGLTAMSAVAAPINPNNTRDTFINLSSPDGATTDMQDILNSWTGGINASTDQQSTGMWAASSGLPFVTAPLLRFEYAGNATTNSMGIWSGTDTSSLTEYTIFNGGASAPSVATILWTTSNAGTITVGLTETAFTGISYNSFGFYLEGNGGKFYTVDQLNNGAAQAVAYRQTGGSATNWLIGFEDVALANSDKDYNDFVFSIESVTAVPEPEIYAMMAAGLGLMGFVARRRQRNGTVV